MAKLQNYKKQLDKAQANYKSRKAAYAKAELEVFSKYGRLKFEELQLKNNSRNLDIDELILEQTAINKNLKQQLNTERSNEQNHND